MTAWRGCLTECAGFGGKNTTTTESETPMANINGLVTTSEAEAQ